MDRKKQMDKMMDARIEHQRNKFLVQIIVAIVFSVGICVAITLLTGCGAEFIHTAIEGDDGCETETTACEEDCQ